MPRLQQRRSRAAPLLLAAALALLVHGPLVLWFLNGTYWNESVPAEPEPLKVTLLKLPPPEEPEELEEPEEEPENDGQIVDIAPPDEPERPDEADFLAEHDSRVDEETVDPHYRLDREVTAPTYSKDDAYELEQAEEMNEALPSTGAMAGREVFQPGQFSLFPDRRSLWDLTNATGLDRPIPASHTASNMAGAPSNDYLPDIASADRTALNAFEHLFASYINRISRYVSFYADQTLSNARPMVPVTRPKYQMQLSILIDADGNLAAVQVTSTSGVPAFDEAIQDAFRLAAPFPEPPEQGLNGAGKFPIPDFGFVITFGAARAEMSGIDPRQSVQFPGLQTIPR